MTILVQPSRSLTQIVTWEHGQSFLVQSSKVSHSVQLFEKESGLQDRLVTDGATFPWLPGAGRDAGRFVVGRCQFALFSHFGSTSGATNREGLFMIGIHSCMMHRGQATRCSIVTNPHDRMRTSLITK